MDLIIPKALSNGVFNNGYSKHSRDMTSGTKLKKMIKEHVWKKNFFLKRIRIRQKTDLKIPRRLVTVFLITVTASIFEI